MYDGQQKMVQPCQVGSAECIFGALGSFPMGGDASLCDPGGESYDTDWFEVAKVGLTLSKYDQLVWTKEAKGCEDRTHGEMLKAELYSALVQTAEGCWNSYTRGESIYIWYHFRQDYETGRRGCSWEF